MKKLLLLTLIVGLFTSSNVSAQQDKSKRASPPAKISQTLGSGAEISIDYSRPSIKGRSLDVLAPAGKVWRTGANEATVFETSKDVNIEGKKLPAGKYSVYSIPGEKEWTIIFNKDWKQWGTVYKESEDALRLNVKPGKAKQFTEMMTFDIAKDGKVSLMWADTQIDFKVQ
ncbi:Protein of unknown function [Daejeonella rubra]|uniref:DUF2911 domain-containing protein n=1 Tax=Daejeonella rubra TaxID=990371 RepID=A0A1G9N5A5_9SPHI|nr:DUF2911 domain-containing protein [Daejeonella rubra]SDL81722.1 Protein of unknown function [Daejeonella rubra]